MAGDSFMICHVLDAVGISEVAVEIAAVDIRTTFAACVIPPFTGCKLFATTNLGRSRI